MLELRLDTQKCHKASMLVFIGIENKKIFSADHPTLHCICTTGMST
jgi:hypothetical protein